MISAWFYGSIPDYSLIFTGIDTMFRHFEMNERLNGSISGYLLFSSVFDTMIRQFEMSV
jgi:hypothetical protein